MAKPKSKARLSAEEVADNATILSPIVGLSASDIATVGLSVAKQAVLQPAIGVEHTARLVAELARIFVGKSEIEPDARDKRFRDPAFTESLYFHRVLQSWYALERSVGEWIDDIGFEEDDAKRARFIMRIVTDAMAPTNFLASNPSALRKARATKGMSVVRGMQNYFSDLVTNGGMPSQVDSSPFHVGTNLGTTPGEVILEHPVAELIQYVPTKKRVRARPIMIAPPQINKFYVYDLTPETSMVKYLLDQGFQVFILSWRNPTPAQRDWGLAEYVDAIDAALAAVRSVTRQKSVDVVGACAGGITVTAALAYFAGLGRGSDVSSLTLMVNVLDPHQDDTEAGLFLNDNVIEAARKRSSRTGVLDGADTARVFTWMRPNDLIWNYVANNYLHGNKPPPFDLLYWNADSTRLPARLHSDFLNVFQDSPFKNAGAMSIRDVPLDVRLVDCPVFVTGGTTDHITPWHACYRSTQIFPTETTFVLSTAGHIQSLINPPGNTKRQYFTNTSTPPDAGDWLDTAEEHAGSWWPYWVDWLRSQSNEQRNAPRNRGNKAYPALRPSPGMYVHES